jgi:hypothetical protein
MAVALGFAAWAIVHEWHPFTTALHALSITRLVLSALCGIVAMCTTFPLWRELLRGLGVDFPLSTGARVFFVSQLGKYVPGSVWPIVLQMEAGRARGASRRTMLTANLLAVAVNTAVGLLVAAVLLPFYNHTVLTRYWWVLLAGILLAGLLHPKIFPRLLNATLARFGREPLVPVLSARTLFRAGLWSVACWILFGLQLGILADAVSHKGLGLYLLCTGAMALAVSAGVLFLPAPAGAGVRDVVVVLLLSAVMRPGAALGLTLITRLSLVVGDLLLALLAWLGQRTSSSATVARTAE